MAVVTIKSGREIELMRKSGRLLARVHEELVKVIRPGISTKEIDTVCEELIRGYRILVGKALVVNVLSNASRTIATHLRLRAVGIKHPHTKIGAGRG